MAKKHIAQNPLIADDMPEDTVNNVCNVLSFLHWVEAGEFSCDLGEKGTCGRMLILQSISNAVESLTPHLKKTAAEVAHV